MHSSQLHIIKNQNAKQFSQQQADDDDWETDPNFVNDLDEKQQRTVGSKAIETEKQTEVIDFKQAKKDVVSNHEEKVKEEYKMSGNFSRGYGGKFGKEAERPARE